MTGHRNYKVTMFLAIWQANLVGLAYGAWLFTGAKDAGPMMSGAIVALWFVSIHVIWTSVGGGEKPRNFGDQKRGSPWL